MLIKLILGLATLLAPILARPEYQDRIPNARNVPHPCKPNHRWPGVGHRNHKGGGALNAFGQHFLDLGERWSRVLCNRDSDGDGRTNGEELGDPGCTWSPGQIPSQTTGITHPGICEPYDSDFCKEKSTFVSCEHGEFKCDAIKQTGVRQKELRFPTTHIPPTETNYYCMTFDLLEDQDYHIIANEPIIDNADVVHHMLLYGCKKTDKASIPTPQPCGMSAEGDCRSIIFGWTVGLLGQCYGNDLGFRVGPKAFKRVRLEIHYNNPMFVPDYKDSSGLRIYYQPVKPQVQDLATFITGQQHIVIPPGQSRVEVTSLCESECTKYGIKEPVHVISAINHMHYMGRSMKIELFRDGEKIANLANDENYRYDKPDIHNHETPVEIRPGDEIKTTCVYDSLSSKRWVYYGESTADEMCYGFLMLYPADNLRKNRCISLGPLSECDIDSWKPIGKCNWVVFSNLSFPESGKIHRALKRNCNLDGFCRPECKQYLMELQSHPCMQGEGAVMLNRVLERSYEGLDFLGRLYSCPMGRYSEDPKGCTEECSEDRCDDKSTSDSAGHLTATTAILVTLAPAVAMLQYL